VLLEIPKLLLLRFIVIMKKMSFYENRVMTFTPVIMFYVTGTYAKLRSASKPHSTPLTLKW